MALSPRQIRERKAELTRYIDSARTVMTVDGGGMKKQVTGKANVPARMRSAFKGREWMWVFGALGVGLLVGILSRRKLKKKSKDSDKEVNSIPASIMGAITTAAISAIRPSVTKIASKAFQKLLKEQFLDRF